MLVGIDASRANRKLKSGVEWYSYHLICELAKLDKANNYILYTDKPLTDGLLDLTGGDYSEISFDKKGFQNIKSPHNNFKAKVLNWNHRFLWTQLRMSWEMIFHRPDLLFIPSHVLPFIHPKKSIVTIHDIGFVEHKNLYDNAHIGPAKGIFKFILDIIVKIITLGKYRATTADYLYWSTKFGLKHASKIITVSNFSKRELLNFDPISADKVSVVYNGFNRDKYSKLVNRDKILPALSKYNLSGPYFLYVGRLDKKKNVSGLIDAFAIFKQKHKEDKHKLVLVGKASFGYDESNYLIKEHDLDNEILIPGWVDEADVPAITCGADAFIFPSKYEGFGLSLLQAMGCEIPVLTSNVAAMPEIAQNAALYFDPNNVYEMSETMSKILEDKKVRNDLIKAGLERINYFNWKKTAEETLSIINKFKD